MPELICCEGAQTSIVQSLTYFEHLSEPMAEFLHILAEQYDYPQLSDEILKYLGVSRITTELIANRSQGTWKQRVQLERYTRAEISFELYREALRACTAADHQADDSIGQTIG
jgi:hypothetical protein